MKILRKKRGKLISVVSLIMLICIQISYGQAKCPALYPITVDCEKCEFRRADGYINSKGDVVVEPKFETAWEFNDGAGVVFIDDDRSGIVNSQGKITIFPEGIHPIPPFSEDVAIGLIKGKYGIIDKTGKTVIIFPFNVESNEYRSPSTFSNGLAKIPIQDKGIVFVDKTGKIVIELGSGYNTFSGFKDGMAVIRLKNGDHGVINRTGKFIFSPVDPREISISEPSDGLVRIGKGMISPGNSLKVEYINKEGTVVLKVSNGIPYDFAEGLAVIRIGEKLGYINKKGKIVIPPQFKLADDFNEGLAAVSLNGEDYGFINQKGKFVIPPQFSLDLLDNSFKCGLAYVQKDKEEGYINKKGEWVWKKN